MQFPNVNFKINERCDKGTKWILKILISTLLFNLITSCYDEVLPEPIENDFHFNLTLTIRLINPDGEPLNDAVVQIFNNEEDFINAQNSFVEDITNSKGEIEYITKGSNDMEFWIFAYKFLPEQIFIKNVEEKFKIEFPNPESVRGNFYDVSNVQLLKVINTKSSIPKRMILESVDIENIYDISPGRYWDDPNYPELISIGAGNCTITGPLFDTTGMLPDFHLTIKGFNGLSFYESTKFIDIDVSKQSFQFNINEALDLSSIKTITLFDWEFLDSTQIVSDGPCETLINELISGKLIRHPIFYYYLYDPDYSRLTLIEQNPRDPFPDMINVKKDKFGWNSDFTIKIKWEF